MRLRILFHISSAKFSYINAPNEFQPKLHKILKLSSQIFKFCLFQDTVHTDNSVDTISKLFLPMKNSNEEHKQEIFNLK